MGRELPPLTHTVNNDPKGGEIPRENEEKRKWWENEMRNRERKKKSKKEKEKKTKRDSVHRGEKKGRKMKKGK